MKDKKLALIFITLLIVDIFYYFIIQFYGLSVTANSIIAFAVYGSALFGLISLTKRKSYTTLYYLGFFVISGVLFLYYMFGQLTIIKYFYILSVLIALVLAVFDLKIRSRKKILTLKKEIQFLKESHELELKNQIANFKGARDHNVNLGVKAAAQEKEIFKAKSRVKECLSDINEYKKKIDYFKEQIPNETVVKTQRKIISKLMTEKSNLEDKLSIKEKEIAKQEELKNKYSKTLRIIRKRKKQEEELLVVAYDGKSVHRPKCIAVRNIPKDNRKLIANWKTAEKEGYRGCGLCRPHIMPKVVVMGSRKYKFVASKDSDKVHKLSCVLVKNIKDKDLFTTYKQALKKGYTACRVCISEDKK
jgi:methylphosphotriester-DNA--protein-cysteine methyltransferase